MQTHYREMMLYYDPESNTHRATLAHARSIVPHLKAFDWRRTPSTGTSWQQIIKALGVPPKELLNKAHPYYQSHIRGREFDEESWIKVLQYNPGLIRGPIAIRGKRAVLCSTPTDIYRLRNL